MSRAVQAHGQSLDAQIGRELKIRVSIADHEAARLVDLLAGEIVAHHADIGFTAIALLMLEVRANAYRLEIDALGCEQFQNEAMGALEFFPWKGGSPEAVLIRDHDEGEAGGFKGEQRRNDARHEPNLFQAVYLLIRRLLVQGAVAIQK